MVIKNFGIVKLKRKSIWTDNFVCELHHNTTRLLLIACQVLALAYEYLGDPMICTNHDDMREKLFDKWCWNHGAYTVPDGRSLADPNLSWKKHHAWYQWSWVMFFAQALLFYVPRYLWKKLEGGKIEKLFQKDDKDKDKNKDEDKINTSDLAKKFHRSFHSHGLYAAKLFFCEILNLVNVIGQLFWLDFILGGKFLRHGPQYVIEAMGRSGDNFYDRIMDQSDLIYQVFPRLAKCQFDLSGPAGEKMFKDTLCMLSINNVNEKIFIFLWFWMYILTLITILHLFRQILQLISSDIRRSALFLELNFYLPGSSLQYIRRNLPSKDLEYVLQKCYFGDWFLLFQLASHFMNPEGFHEFIKELRKNLDMPPFYEIEVKTLEVVEVIKEKNVKLPKEPGENLVEVNSEEIKYVEVMA